MDDSNIEQNGSYEESNSNYDKSSSYSDHVDEHHNNVLEKQNLSILNKWYDFKNKWLTKNTKRGKCLCFFGIPFLILLLIILGNLQAVYTFSQKCSYGVVPIDDSIYCPNSNNTGKCEIYFKTFSEKIAFCLDGNTILEQYSCNLDDVLSQYCNNTIDNGLMFPFTLIGIMWLFIEILLILMIPTLYIIGCIGLVFGLTQLGKSKNKIIIGAITCLSIIMTFIVSFIIFMYGLKSFYNGIDLPEDFACSFYQECIKDAENCIGTDEYCIM